MGTAFGNVLALILVGIAAVIGFVSFEASAVTYTAIAYGGWFVVTIANYLTRPRKDASFCKVLDVDEVSLYQDYHTYLWFPGAAEALSAALNALRVAGFGWGALCIWKGLYWLGCADIAFFFVSGNIILKLNPVLYMKGAAIGGNDVAIHITSLIESIQTKRGVYNTEEE